MIKDNNIYELLDKEELSRQELIGLLSLDPKSKEVEILLKKSREYATKYGENKGKVWGAIGLDYMPCKMNCNFCSLADDLNIIKESVEFTEEEIMYIVKRFVDLNIDWLTIRTTEFYDFDKLISIIKRIKREFPGDYILTVNTGDSQTKRAKELKEAGVDLAYHCIRLREGEDTNFSFNDRLNTIRNLKNADIMTAHCIEPIGPEHTNEEIADKMIEIIDLETDVTGVMQRVTVPGTLKSKFGNLERERLAQITAIMRIYGKDKIKDFFIHPAYDECIDAGANCLVVDFGAIPRDKDFSIKEWKGQSVGSARNLLKEHGYETNI